MKINTAFKILFNLPFYFLFPIPVFAVTLQPLSAPESKVVQYGKWEITFTLDQEFKNPFDPDEADVVGVFKTSGGKTVTIPAFYDQPFKRSLFQGAERVEPAGAPRWALRFAPVETGKHTCEIKVNGQAVTPSPVEWECVAGEEKGFVRIHPQNRYGFSFDNGENFFPIGHNVRFLKSQAFGERIPLSKGTFLYDELFEKMSLHGENFLILGMEAWWLGLEWTKSADPFYQGLGKYNLKNAWMLDHLLEKAFERDVYVALFLTSHGQFAMKSDKWPDGHWEQSPYNVQNGGPFAHPNSFFKDPMAKKNFQRLLRYVIARWGYQSHLMSWLLLSEVDLVQEYLDLKGDMKWSEPSYKLGNLIPWHQEMAQYLKQNDPWRHLVSTSFAFISHEPGIWRMPEMDFVFNTAFISEYGDNSVDIVKSYEKLTRDYEKPFVLAEYGGHARKNDKESLKAFFHTGLWAQYMTPRCTSVSGFWWWGLIETEGLYKHFKALAEFHLGENRVTPQFSAIQAKLGNKKLGFMGIQSEKVHYFWVYENQSQYDRENLNVFENVTLSYKALNPGKYLVEFWDTVEGTIIQSTKVETDQDLILRFSLPPFKGDVVFKIRRK